MRYVQLLEHLFIASNNVTAQVHKSIDDFRTDPFVKFILVLFSRSAFEIKVFVIQLIGRNFKRVKISWSTVSLTLNRRFVMITACDWSVSEVFTIVVLNVVNILFGNLASVLFLYIRFSKVLLLNILCLSKIDSETKFRTIAIDIFLRLTFV